MRSGIKLRKVDSYMTEYAQLRKYERKLEREERDAKVEREKTARKNERAKFAGGTRHSTRKRAAA